MFRWLFRIGCGIFGTFLGMLLFLAVIGCEKREPLPEKLVKAPVPSRDEMVKLLVLEAEKDQSFAPELFNNVFSGTIGRYPWMAIQLEQFADAEIKNQMQKLRLESPVSKIAELEKTVKELTENRQSLIAQLSQMQAEQKAQQEKEARERTVISQSGESTTITIKSTFVPTEQYDVLVMNKWISTPVLFVVTELATNQIFNFTVNASGHYNSPVVTTIKIRAGEYNVEVRDANYNRMVSTKKIVVTNYPSVNWGNRQYCGYLSSD